MKTAVETIDDILVMATKSGASDIHCDPRENDILIRFRIDGIMEDAGIIPKRLHEEIIARLKILAGARTDVHFVPQDGRWKSHISDKPYNIRISFMPTYHGENAVLRILPMSTVTHLSFSELGFTAYHDRAISKALEKTHGLILITGPTGSGKTTTLHACLNQIAKNPLSIITLEDPIEYEMKGVRQVHIRHNHGVTFASGLRSALRQDPDVIMVGEIRDSETASVAVHTALTGHLVFSTLHTNSALETIPRLLDMGVDHYLLASTLELIVAQRLIRKLCESCDGHGCDFCRKSGYVGRSVIAEVCEVNSSIKSMIARRETVSPRECMQTQEFIPLMDDGLEKVQWGVTSKAEVLRVLST